jgi:beta-glucosidase-like glycosyl hydrolase
MVGHLNVPSLSQDTNTPTVISNQVIKEVLRKELGFRGVVVTDALNMHAVSEMFPEKGELEWRAFDAGNDILCFTEHIREGIDRIVNKAAERDIEDSFKRVWKLKEKAFNSREPLSKSLIDPVALNKKLARESLTLYKGTEEGIKVFKEKAFIGIDISKNADNQFFKFIKTRYEFKCYSTSENSLQKIKEVIMETENVLLSIVPPKAKPQHNFEISEDELAFIRSLIRQKKVIVYLFGNPYVLNLINPEHAEAVVVAYQDFKVFQENAANHFLGKVSAMGSLAVSINTYIQ